MIILPVMMMLKNDIIRLRAVEPEDLSLLYEAENDTQIWWVGDQHTPYSRYALKQYLISASNDIYSDKQVRFVVERISDSQPMGFIDLFEYSPRHHRAESGILIFEQFRNQGYGSMALDLLLRYAKAHLHLHQIYAYVSVDNSKAVDLYYRAGFNLTHRLKDWIKESTRYSDALFLQKII